MSSNMTEIANNPSRPKQQTDCSKLWIILSFLLSALIIAWTFSLPFRSSHLVSVTNAEPSSKTAVLDLVDQVKLRKTEAEAYREAALALDQEFMEAVARKNQQAVVPGIEHTVQNWEKHEASVKRQLQMLGNPEKGTPEYEHAMELLDSLKDGPRLD